LKQSALRKKTACLARGATERGPVDLKKEPPNTASVRRKGGLIKGT